MAKEGEMCWDTCRDLTAAVRAICESHDGNFKLDALKFKQLSPHPPFP